MTNPRQGRAPAYQRIADTYRDKIASGELQGGDQLPTEKDIATLFGVARQTARNGLGVLMSDGLIVARRPHGHFVREHEHMVYEPQRKSRLMPATPEMDRFTAQIRGEGRIPRYAIEVALVRAGPDLAGRLHTSPDEIIVARRRVRYINDEPININDSHFRQELVKGSAIMSPEYIPRGTDRVLVELGHRQHHAIDEILVRMPTPAEAYRLGLGPGTPVAVHYDTAYTAEGLPISCTLNVLPGDRHKIVFERHWPPPTPEPNRG
jgi:GntR family transcriptional regulator